MMVLVFLKTYQDLGWKGKRKLKLNTNLKTYAKNVKNNVGKVFRKLLKKHFPVSHIQHKNNKNTIKISYIRMKNINSVISACYKNILNPRTASFGCNCWNKENCSLNGESLTSKLVYRRTVTNAVNEDLKKIHWLSRYHLSIKK